THLPGGRVGGRHILDGDLQVSELTAQTVLDQVDRVEDQVIKLRRPGTHRGHRRPCERASHPTAATVTPTHGRSTVPAGHLPTSLSAARGRALSAQSAMSRADRPKSWA